MRPDAIARATSAIAQVRIDPASPFAAAEVRVQRSLGLDAGPDADRLAFWRSRQPGSRAGDDRYRWEVSHKRHPPAPHAGPRETWRQWRADVENDLDRSELRISLPMSVAETCDYLASLAEGPGPDAGDARALLDEALPLFRRDLAPHVQCSHPWTDTFALACVARRPRTLARVPAIATAIATSAAGLVVDGAVHGLQFPFHEQALPSASAQLGLGLFVLGLEVDLLAQLVAYVRSAQQPTGGFRDPMPPKLAAKYPEVDPLTTFAAADLLLRLDPSFDGRSARDALFTRQGDDGFIREMGPEAVWLTGEAVLLARDVDRPFAERFRWPMIFETSRDRKTKLPFFAYFDDISRLFARIEGLREAPTPMGFLDLAGFREFNNTYGQDMGDAVLGAFAEELAKLPAAAVVRDGGDEFLVVGAPLRGSLAADLNEFRRAWPERFRARFGSDAPPVAPRVLVTQTPGKSLRECREMLGRRVGALKLRSKVPPPEGILEEL